MPPQLVPNRARKKSPSTPDKAANGISNVSIDCSHDCDGDGPEVVAPESADRDYFTFVNYTTLGYGDVTPVKRWNLLGPMTAMNGVLLFGWSTAVIFEVLRMTLLGATRAIYRSGNGRSSSAHATRTLDLYQSSRRGRCQPLHRAHKRAASKCRAFRDHLGPPIQGEQHETLDRVISIAGCWLHGRDDGAGQRHRLLPVCRLSRRLHCKGRRRAPPAACRARGGDPRGRPCRHTHEPWRSGGSRRPSLKGPFLPQ